MTLHTNCELSQQVDFYYENTLQTVAFCLSEEITPKKQKTLRLKSNKPKKTYYDFTINEIAEEYQSVGQDKSVSFHESWNSQESTQISLKEESGSDLKEEDLDSKDNDPKDFIQKESNVKQSLLNKHIIISNSLSLQKLDSFDVVLEQINNDDRSTLMIKNIPNKYTSKLLREKINAHFKDHYDFFYLPMDFKVTYLKKHKCNYGYAFINIKEKKDITAFYQKFHLSKWEYFKSNKICQIKYARIQGKQELEKHFQHTNVLNGQQNQDLANFMLPQSGFSFIDNASIQQDKEYFF